MNSPYSALAECYDKLNAHIDYERWADFVVSELRAHGVPDGALMLDLGCGTGNMTIPLARRGYDMIGVDLSPEMLGAAMTKQRELPILWLCQDMRSFELYGTVGAVVSCLDSINYLTGRTGLKRCFSLVHNYLDPNGIFLFDVNTPYKFAKVYGNEHYVMEAEGVYCGWKNDYDPKTGLCDFALSIFAEQEDGSYRRYDEWQRERCWPIKTLRSLLEDTGFELLNIVSDFEGKPLTDESERAYFLCRAKK